MIRVFDEPWCGTMVVEAPVEAGDVPPPPGSVVVPVAVTGAGLDPPPADDIGLSGGWTGLGKFGM